MDDEDRRRYSTSWERRELERLRDERVDRIEHKVDSIAKQFYIGLGVLSVVVFVANIVGPIIAGTLVRLVLP